MLVKQRTKKLLTRILSFTITTLLLTACGAKDTRTAESKTTIESTAETTGSIIILESTNMQETTTEAPDEPIRLLDDGTYYVSDDIRKRLREYIPFCEWNDSEFEIGLQNFMTKFCSEAETVDELFIVAEELSKNIMESREQAKQEYLSQQVQQGQEKVNPKGYHLIKDTEGDIVCTQELRDAIHNSLSKAGLEVHYRQEILNRYYIATLDMDNTTIHNDIIDTIISSLKKEIEVQQSVVDEKKEQDKKIEETQQPSDGNTQVDANGFIYEDNNEYPSGNIYEEEGPRLDDPTAGKEEIDYSDIIAENTANAGDGGDLVTNIEVKPAGE